jgi:FkbM family methyltransferase
MKTLGLDWYISSLTRKISSSKYSHKIINNLRKKYINQYQKQENSWIIINDFDGNLKFKLDPSSYIGSLIYWRGYHSVNEISLMKKILKQNMTFVDIGANQGEYTIFAAKRLIQGQVISFEPLSTSYNHLKENIKLNQFNNVMTYNFALSDTKGYAKIYTSDDLEIHSSFNEGLSSLYQSNYRNALLEKVEVEVFDRVWKNHNNLSLDIIKIDVEGSELPVLKGAINTIKKYKPLIILEINEETFQEAGYAKDELIIFLENLNYKFSLIKPKGKTEEINSSQIHKLCNILCF